MRNKNIVGFFGNLDALAKFLKEQQQEEEEFSQYAEGGHPSLYNVKQIGHFIHTEDDSIIKQMRGY